MTNYQVNFLVKAVISVDVKAENFEEAKRLAFHKLDNVNLFTHGITYHDGKYEICGYDDDDMWAEIN